MSKIFRELNKIELDVYFTVPFVSADDPGSGNPAAVCIVPPEVPISFATMSNIARELAQPETIFARFRSQGCWEIRNFTPGGERIIPGGNGTVALAWLLLTELDNQSDTVYLDCEFSWLAVTAKLSGSTNSVSVTLPSVAPSIVQAGHEYLIRTSMSITPNRVLCGERDAIALYDDEAQVLSLIPDFGKLAQARLGNELPFFAVIATAPTSGGFVYRTFVLGRGEEAFECPGSAAALQNLPALFKDLGFGERLHADQLSARGGEAWCELLGNNRVELSALCERRCGPARFEFPIMGGEIDCELGLCNDPFIWI